MGLGDTARKLQKVTQAAEELYGKMNEVIGKLKELQEEVSETSEQVDRIERDLAEQRAVLEALAQRQDVDVDEVLDDLEAAKDADAPADATATDSADAADGDGSDVESGDRTPADSAAPSSSES